MTTRWWEIPRDRQRQGRQGTLALEQGKLTGITCPECGDAPVVYNGNYFCDDFDAPALSADGQRGNCDWVLPHPTRSKRDRKICDLIGIDYQ